MTSLVRFGLFAGVLVCIGASAAPPIAPSAAGPKLAVFLVVDQLSTPDFEARQSRMKAGFKRLMQQGHWLREVRYEAAPTVTAVGHATLSTGAYGNVHGIVANEWVDGATGKPRLAGEDPAFQVVGRAAKTREVTAPTWLMAPTLSESVRAHAAGAKSVVVSGKDRSAVLSAGRSADVVLWFDMHEPKFVTSTFYAQALPAWLAPINERVAQQAQRLSLQVEKGGGRENEPFAEHPALQGLIDRSVVEVALEALKAEKLGADDVPDLLTISFSGHDRLGHQFGADGAETLAQFDLIDAELGRLFDGLDAQVGKGQWVAVLTADHGVAPRPELAQSRGLQAGRTDVKSLRGLLEAEADTALGLADWFAGVKVCGPTAEPGQAPKLWGIAERLRRVALKHPGVSDLWPMPEVLAGHHGDVGQLYARGAYPGRSPDFILVTKPYFLFGVGDVTGHSTHYVYDRAVPAVFLGAGVRPGVSQEPRQSVDVAPTLARLLRVPPPAATVGHVMPEVLATERSISK
jgi:hypothetical protein